MYAKEYYESGEANGREYRNKTQFFDAIDGAEDKAVILQHLEDKLWWRSGYPEVELSMGSTPANTSSSDYVIRVLFGEVEEQTVEQHSSDWYRHRTIRLVPKTQLAIVKVSKDVHRGWDYEVSKTYYIIKRDD
jgi:hypothetical protein